MIGITRTRILRAVLCAVICLGAVVPCAFAQSLVPGLSSIESIIGPIVPTCGITSTFRSEVGTGLSVMALNRAQLSDGLLASQFGVPAVSLEDYANLDKYPVRFDAYVNLRLWRFGARARWSSFDDSSLSPNLGRYEFTGITLGGDFDVIQHCWLVLGASVDFYLGDPEFHGVIRQPLVPANTLNVDLTGKRPATIGAYARYIPPEIINIPVHVELYANFPLYGSRLTSYGGALVFRPQIYRFDLAAKAIIEKNYMKVMEATDSPNPYRLDTEWSRYGAELAVYF